MDFWWQIFFHIFPRKNGLKFVAPQTSENVTTFSTARKEIYHLELALGATSREKKITKLELGRLLVVGFLHSHVHAPVLGDLQDLDVGTQVPQACNHKIPSTVILVLVGHPIASGAAIARLSIVGKK